MAQVLRREMGLGGAIVTGLGSILGTGAFVAIGVASGLWGDAVLMAIPIAGAVALFNGLSSAFLAGRFPVAGGTYEYGYRTLGASWGFTAGWLFLLAKTASAAAAALGMAAFLDVPWDPRISAGAAVVVLTALVLAGLKRTIIVNSVLVISDRGLAPGLRVRRSDSGRSPTANRRGLDSTRSSPCDPFPLRGIHRVWPYRHPRRGSAPTRGHHSQGGDVDPRPRGLPLRIGRHRRKSAGWSALGIRDTRAARPWSIS